ncbi:hypothetical protein BH10PLA1_BH10PLA1_18170 [soil metagenome]
MIDWLIALQRPWPFPKYRLINPFLPTAGTREARVFGASFHLDLSDLIQRDIYVGCYERNETAVFRKILRPGNTLVDVGANVGYFTALGSHIVGRTGRVISVEPNPSGFAKLDSMVERSGITWCSRFNIGLSDAIGHITLYEPPAEHHNLNSTMNPVDNYKPIDVQIRTLDDLLDEQKIECVDLIKVDVEGHEPKVFAGGSKFLSSGASGTSYASLTPTG